MGWAKNPENSHVVHDDSPEMMGEDSPSLQGYQL